MAKAKKTASKSPEPVSVKYWIFDIILCWFPGINLLFFIPLALFSQNQTMKHFYIANLWIFILTICLFLAIIMFTVGPVAFEQLWNLLFT